MVKSLVAGGLLAMSLALGGSAQAQSSCDAGVTKALGQEGELQAQAVRGGPEEGDGRRLRQARQVRSEVRRLVRQGAEPGRLSGPGVELRRPRGEGRCRRRRPPGHAPATTTTSTTASTTTTLDPFRPCGRGPDGMCGGLCDSFFDDCVQDDQSGACVCVPGPCRAVGGIGSCGGTCQDPRAVCTLFPVPGGCVCIIPCAGSGAPPCDPACQPGQGCILNPNTSACECAP